MQRTTIMLPDDLKNKAQGFAHATGMSLGELIREALNEKLSQKDPNFQRDTLIDDKEVFSSPTPPDLSENHDDYSYGEKK